MRILKEWHRKKELARHCQTCISQQMFGHDVFLWIINPYYPYSGNGHPLLNWDSKSRLEPSYCAKNCNLGTMSSSHPGLPMPKKSTQEALRWPAWTGPVVWDPLAGQETDDLGTCQISPAKDGKPQTYIKYVHSILGLFENVGYIPNYSHLIGIMIINHWVYLGVHYFQTHPYGRWCQIIICGEVVKRSLWYDLPSDDHRKDMGKRFDVCCYCTRWGPLVVPCYKFVYNPIIWL